MNRFDFYRAGLAVLILSLPFVGCGDSQEKVQPTIGPITESVYASGALKAREQYAVYAQVSGLVVISYVSEGDIVKAGEPLFLIDDRASTLGSRNSELSVALLEKDAARSSPVLAQLRAARTRAKETLDNDAELFEEAKQLRAKNLVSQNELERKRLAVVTAQANFDAASEAFEESQTRLTNELAMARNNLAISLAAEEDRTVRSLLDGMVYDVLVEKGELASIQSPLAIVGSATDFYIQLAVDEYDIAKIEPDQRVLITMDSYQGQLLEARITKIAPLMDQRSRTFTVEAVFTTPPKRLYPHLTVEANIVIRTERRALTIPSEYLVDGESVLIGDGKRRKVEIGLRDLERVEIEAGLDTTVTLYKPQ